ncbi:hypothetical protein LOD99_5672 [Oopsacas minuta]|uniref:Uncharacterized protein n=1 Tax=Oopsacas minuta TaxID=111878 RepID=A0AAV7JRV9_9METZ|nr:hypothetical protein LOD99_5672 [Oopsacas minuta]
MYRARREIEPPIPITSIQFLEMIPSSQFDICFEGGVEVSYDVGIVFFSNKMAATLSEVEDVYFDGTFYTRFQPMCYQLSSILTSKNEELYTAILAKVHELVPQLIPIHGISGWDRGARNPVKYRFRVFFFEVVTFITPKVFGGRFKN